MKSTRSVSKPRTVRTADRPVPPSRGAGHRVSMACYLGIDAGGTRTRALVAGATGKILGRGIAGPANPLKVGFAACERQILRAANQAVAAVYDRRVSPRLNPSLKKEEAALVHRRYSPQSAVIDRRYSISNLGTVVVGLAGVDRPPVHRRLLRWLTKAIPARRHLLTSDAAIALAAAIGKRPGIVIIAGTGSIGYAEDGRGRAYRAGGWGTLYDDAGSGFDLGRKAIVAALRDYDGRGDRTVLGRKICRALKIHDITEVILKALTPQETAALFPLVLGAAREHDAVAKRLCLEAGRELAELALALATRLGWRRRLSLLRQRSERSHACELPAQQPPWHGVGALRLGGSSLFHVTQ